MRFLVVSTLVFCSLLACSRRDSRKQTARQTESRTIEAADSAVAANGAGPRVELALDGGASPLPIVDGPTLLGKIRASGHKGVVVNVWASWCDPCREELPMLNQVAGRLAALDVPIWLVSVDDPDVLVVAKALLGSLHIELASFAAAPPLEAFKAALNPHWPGMIPVSFLFDGEGKLRYFWRGEVFASELVPLVQDFAAGKHIDGVSNFGLAPGATEGPP